MILRIAILLTMVCCVALLSGVPKCSAEEIQGGKEGQEHRTMEGVEIQGTVEKPHAVYVIPWSDIQDTVQENMPLKRSFREEILKPVDHEEFHRKE